MLRYVLALVASLILVVNSWAQSNPAPFSFERVGVGFSSGLITYGETDGIENTTAGYVRGAVAYSTGKQLSFGVGLQRDFTNSFNTLDIGARMLVVGTGTGERSQLALGAGYVHYEDEPGIEHDSSWNCGLYSAYNIAGAVDKPVRWYGVGNAIFDQNNNRFSAQLGLLAAWSPYKTR